jgi:hypothetical protein
MTDRIMDHKMNGNLPGLCFSIRQTFSAKTDRAPVKQKNTRLGLVNIGVANGLRNVQESIIRSAIKTKALARRLIQNDFAIETLKIRCSNDGFG